MKQKEKQKERLVCGTLFAVLVPIEGLCAFLAFHTIGEIECAVYFLAIAINIPFVILALTNPKSGAVACVLLALAIIPYQCVLGIRLSKTQDEVTRIIAFIENVKATTGTHPEDLSGYVFRNPNVSPYIQGYRVIKGDAGFVVTYFVGTKSTSHWYSSKTGWGYYPD